MNTRKEPYVRIERPGARVVCACGKSTMRPYCDGSHTGTHRDPIVVNIDEEREVAWCGCRRSRNFPYCDGTHETL